jgi:hypothetical protein
MEWKSEKIFLYHPLQEVIRNEKIPTTGFYFKPIWIETG